MRRTIGSDVDRSDGYQVIAGQDGLPKPSGALDLALEIHPREIVFLQPAQVLDVGDDPFNRRLRPPELSRQGLIPPTTAAGQCAGHRVIL
jgi:hypothetical protein